MSDRPLVHRFYEGRIKTACGLSTKKFPRMYGSPDPENVNCPQCLAHERRQQDLAAAATGDRPIHLLSRGTMTTSCGIRVSRTTLVTGRQNEVTCPACNRNIRRAEDIRRRIDD